jgi:3',5'-cyclic AMP phosphodiesterase CpdA
MMSALEILHISDFHFGSNHAWSLPNKGTDAFTNAVASKPTLAEAIHATLETYHIRPAGIVMTGDFTDYGCGQEFTHFSDFLRTLMKMKRMERVQGVLLIPGNHDLLWFNDNGAIKALRQSTDGTTGSLEWDSISFAKRMAAFFEMKRSLYSDGTLPRGGSEHAQQLMSRAGSNNKKLEELLIKVSSFGFDYQVWTDPDQDWHSILAVGMNSVLLDCSDFPGIGCLGLDQLDALKHVTEIIGHSVSGKVAALHHHILPTLPIEEDYLSLKDNDLYKKVSITLDGRLFLNRISQLGYRVVLHGHQHHPSLVSWRDRLSEHEGNAVNVICAGSIGAPTNPQFFSLAVMENGLVVKDFRVDSDARTFMLREQRRALKLYWPSPALNTTKDECTIVFQKAGEIQKAISPESTAHTNSYLYYLFLDTSNMAKIQAYIGNQDNRDKWKKQEITLCATYHVWGQYDTVLICRSPRDRTHIETNLVDVLKVAALIKIDRRSGDAICELMQARQTFRRREIVTSLTPDVTANGSHLDFRRKPMNNDGYNKGHLTRAFVICRSEQPHFTLTATVLLTHLKRCSDLSFITPIIEMISEFDDKSRVVFSILMTCQETKYLGQLSDYLDPFIDQFGNRSTLIAYHCTEFEHVL